MPEQHVPYKPTPIGVDDVNLPPDLLELVELLAQNAHDIWADKRLSEDWIFGPERDDRAKRHPCLRPYSELPDNERDFDRVLVRQTMKTILKLGYHIRKNAAG